ncbi:MAG TPA: hypothetical protein ENH53_05115 [Bacteroidetes bacterium]|nr:hypothetical protein [Bacteroidota bacterium]
MDVVAVPETIQEKLGSKGANDLIWLINQIITKQRLSIEHVELRFEHLLSREIGKLRIEFKTDLSKLREEIALLDKRVAENNANLIKWMFIFWVGQVGVMIGILFAFFK